MRRSNKALTGKSTPAEERPAAPFDVSFATLGADDLRDGDRSHVAALVAVGDEFIAPVWRDDPRLVSLGMSRFRSDSTLEVFRSPTPVDYGRWREIAYAQNSRFLSGTIRFDESAAGLASDVERAYQQILEFSRCQSVGHLLRIWNYIPRLNEGVGDAERYKQFSLGRHRAFADAGLTAERPPAASCVGWSGSGGLIHFLAVDAPPTFIENPRQVSAFQYPRQHGPASPSFSRAALFCWKSGAALLTSGTASIVGHETRHVGDPRRQTAESLANLAAILDEGNRLAEYMEPMQLEHARGLRVYVRHQAHVDEVSTVVERAIGPMTHVNYVAADICRRELLVEIEGYWSTTRRRSPQRMMARSTRV